jgi:ABC-type transporter Mla subunit MlaD
VFRIRIDVYHHLGSDAESKLDQVLAALTTIKHTGEKALAQIDDLKAALDDVSGKVDAVGTEVQDLIAKLQALLGQTAPDLAPLIAQAQGIAAKLAAIPPEPA